MLKKLAVLLVLLGVAFGVMMLTTRSSTFVVANSLGFAQSPEQIWPTLLAVEDWPRWWPGVEKAWLPQGWQRGASFELELRGTPTDQPASVSAMVEAKELAWRRPGVLGSYTLTTFKLVKMAEGTEVFLESSIHGPQAFLARITGRDEFGQYHDQVLGALRAFLERGGETAPAGLEQ
ncbi:hypothetical protein DESUT3_11470 [Desulfuromonas versatilis]|uniref:Polyketide cyclase/dehydrase n=1 Tax=Desulfuromonas versatilis TaxID=2802975 RepID=A0ABM8HQJ5_9BACT|nr:SRPBCC family protein [Desulfuromonas versatilis]BCR04078.1 hypothetical protein DESUT3_11470 [Desulfuromonas versatilis]